MSKSGSKSVFSLQQLYAVVESRKDAKPEDSYSARLFAAGRAKQAQKLGEEAVETVIEAVALQPGGDPTAMIGESSDLLYHLVVLWADAGITVDDVMAELRRRHQDPNEKRGS